jgi:diguanylate cyclase (GGDEF)-like protein
VLFRSVSENRRLWVTVADQALRDPLRGLANRALFNERLDHAVELRERDGSTVSVVAVDLNDFKLVNDSLGHPVGGPTAGRCGQPPAERRSFR